MFQMLLSMTSSKFQASSVKTLPPEIAGSRMTKEGVLVIISRRFRTQAQNRDDALEQLKDLLRRAEIRPKVHLKTRVPLGQKNRRREDKTKHGEKKKGRRVQSWREE